MRLIGWLTAAVVHFSIFAVAQAAQGPLVTQVKRLDTTRLELSLDETGQRSQQYTLHLDTSMFSHESQLRTQNAYLHLDRSAKEFISVIVDGEDSNGDVLVSGTISSERLGGTFTISNIKTKRNLQSSEVYKDAAIEHPRDRSKRLKRERLRKKKRTKSKSHSPPISKPAGDAGVASSSDVTAWFPGCFMGDNAPLTVTIGIVTDVSYLERINAATPNVDEVTMRTNIQREVERSLSFVRPLYLAQLNVQLVVGQLIISSPTSTSSTLLRSSRRSGTCPKDPLLALSQLATWSRSAPPMAHWHLITDCFPSGVIGAGYIGGLCSASGSNVALSSYTDYLWLTVAHEIGHVFGATHTFMGGQGGIMDYGNGRLFGGAVQFHPANQDQMCGTIAGALNAKCRFLNVQSQQGVCGNGVLEPDEDCECLPGRGSCAPCVQCQLADRNTRQCSTTSDGFVIRTATTPPFISAGDASFLGSTECCSPTGLLSARSCNNGRDVCGPTGVCRKACATFLLPPCGFDDTGCVQRCVSGGICMGAELTSQGAPYSPAGAVPDGLVCRTSARTQGRCLRGVCIADAGAPTRSPVGVQDGSPTTSTLAPMSLIPPATSSTRAPTVSTRSPTFPTAKPVASTNSPSLPATQAPSAQSTRSPTLGCPEDRLLVLCPLSSTLGSCGRMKGCVWCSTQRKCTASKLLCNQDASGLEALFGHCPPFQKSITLADAPIGG